MSLKRNLFFMGASTGARLGCGLLTFLVMARLLGPEQFGVVMLWLSVATLATLAANFGFTPYLLREIGARPESARLVMSEVLTAKLLLAAVILIGGAAFLGAIEPAHRSIFGALLVALIADSLTEFLNVGFRATNRYAEETRLASLTAVLQFAVIGVSVWCAPTANVAASAFCVSRVVATLAAWAVQRNYFRGLELGGFRAGFVRLREGLAYAIDFGLQSLFGQIDSLMLNHFAGPVAVGVYQAGMRIFNGGAQAASVLANVFLPRAAAAANDPKRFIAEAARVQWAFILVGAGFGLGLAIGAELIVPILFGPAYSSLVELLPWMGVLFFVRFYAASWGVVLTSAGQQSFRAWINLIQWIGVLSVAALWVANWGILGWVYAILAGHVFIAAAYAVRCYQHTGMGWAQTSFVAATAFAFIPWVHLPAISNS